MDNINLEVLKQLQAFAMDYFNSIVELNSIDGKCVLKPGKYTAKEMAADPCKTFGQYYAIPLDEKFEEQITIQSGSFHASFPYRNIFKILDQWESMARAGKLKAVFEIEGAEEKTAPVVINKRTPLGTIKTKKMQLIKIAGNWWRARKISKNACCVTAYYELNGVIFSCGKTFQPYEIEEGKAQQFCEKWSDKEMIDIVRSYIRSEKNEEEYKTYYRDVLQMAGVSIEEAKEEPQTPQITTETTEPIEVTAEEEKCEETANMPTMYNIEWQMKERFKQLPNISKLAANGVFIRGVAYHTEYYRTINSNAELLARVDNLPWNIDRHDSPYQGSGVFGKTELFDNWEGAVIATIDALTEYLQSQTAQQPIETDTPPDTPPTTGNAVETNLEPPKPTVKESLTVPPQRADLAKAKYTPEPKITRGTANSPPGKGVNGDGD